MNWFLISNYIATKYDLSNFNHVLGAVSQTKTFGGSRTYDLHANSLAHYPLDYQGTLLTSDFLTSFTKLSNINVIAITIKDKIFPLNWAVALTKTDKKNFNNPRAILFCCKGSLRIFLRTLTHASTNRLKFSQEKKNSKKITKIKTRNFFNDNRLSSHKTHFISIDDNWITRDKSRHKKICATWSFNLIWDFAVCCMRVCMCVYIFLKHLNDIKDALKMLNFCLKHTQYHVAYVSLAVPHNKREQIDLPSNNCWFEQWTAAVAACYY